MKESDDEEFNRIQQEIEDMLGQSGNVTKFNDYNLIHEERGDQLIRSFSDMSAAVNYANVNGDQSNTYAIVENEDTGKFEVYEMANKNLDMDEGQLSPLDEHRRDAGSYEEAYAYIDEIGAGASYFGIVDMGGHYAVYYIAG